MITIINYKIKIDGEDYFSIEVLLKNMTPYIKDNMESILSYAYGSIADTMDKGGDENEIKNTFANEFMNQVKFISDIEKYKQDPKIKDKVEKIEKRLAEKLAILIKNNAEIGVTTELTFTDSDLTK